MHAPWHSTVAPLSCKEIIQGHYVVPAKKQTLILDCVETLLVPSHPDSSRHLCRGPRGTQTLHGNATQLPVPSIVSILLASCNRSKGFSSLRNRSTYRSSLQVKKTLNCLREKLVQGPHDLECLAVGSPLCQSVEASLNAT
ncbi:hypothetical protein BC830DRAFT_1118650 [Chytriomyces sp. MP71]|nr:hypothetical protein BC830DRAFT_1118650 [Chytriomyces sp. MP71]